MIKIALNEYQTAIRPPIIKEPNNLMIYDKKEETLISVNNIKYKGKAMKEWKFRDTEKRNNEVLTLTKTTEIKEIGGYIARKYIVEGKGIEGFMWLTKEIDADFEGGRRGEGSESQRVLHRDCRRDRSSLRMHPGHLRDMQRDRGRRDGKPQSPDGRGERDGL